jgi:hypothetical protein
MLEQEDRMRFWMSGELQSNIGEGYRVNGNKLEAALDNYFQPKSYGAGAFNGRLFLLF